MAHHHHHHAHESGCDHDHGAASGRAFGIGIALNSVLIVAEVFFGLRAGSMALLADAGHNLGDVLGLVLSGAAVWLAARRPSTRYTYGLQSSSILAALANTIILLVAVGGVAWESVLRLLHPAPVEGLTVMIVAAIGIIVNGGTAALFMAGRRHDINIRAAFLHMLSDAVTSAGVVVAGLVIWRTGWQWLDPLVSLVIAGLIVAGTWGLLKDSVNLALQGVPPGIDAARVKAWLAARPGVASVHDLHIWAMSTTETALTAHLAMPADPGASFLNETGEALRRDFGIGHATLQIETGGGDVDCRLHDHAAG